MKRDKRKREELNLPLVRFAPFMAAGMLTACFGGGLFCGIVFAAAAVSAVCFVKKRKRAALCAVGLVWGLAVMMFHLEFYCKPVLNYDGKTVSAEFAVIKSSMFSGGNKNYTVEMNLAGRRAVVAIGGRNSFEVGDIVTAVVALNEADSDDKLQNLADGVLLSGEITELIAVGSGGNDLFTPIGKLRERMLEMISGNIFGSGGELALAMLLGEDSALSPALREKLKICGASHYTAVSGSHFALFAAVLIGIIPKRYPRFKRTVSLLFAPAAVIFFGMSPSVLRASVMFMLYSIAPLFHREANTLNSLCAAVVIICTFSPGTILDTGFGMSVLGVFGAGVVGTEISKKLCTLLPDKMKGLSAAVNVFAVSVCALICTSPISVYAFNGISLLGAFSSVILIPFMTVSIIFAILLGITGMSLFALPIDLAMGVAAVIVNFLGDRRESWITFDLGFEWAIAAACVLLLSAAAFGNMKKFAFSGACIAVLSAVSLFVSLMVCEYRSEVRFVGNYTTAAAVVFRGKEAVVFISGGGTGLASGISRTMREHGAVRINSIAAYDADYGGVLAIRELSEMSEIGAVYSNDIARNLLGEMNVKTVPENSRLSVSGITVAAAGFSDKEVAADIVLYNGRTSKAPESSAKYAVYFSETEKDMPKNWHNARRDRELCIKLKSGAEDYSIIQ